MTLLNVEVKSKRSLTVRELCGWRCSLLSRPVLAIRKLHKQACGVWDYLLKVGHEYPLKTLHHYWGECIGPISFWHSGMSKCFSLGDAQWWWTWSRWAHELLLVAGWQLSACTSASSDEQDLRAHQELLSGPDAFRGFRKDIQRIGLILGSIKVKTIETSLGPWSHGDPKPEGYWWE